MDCMVHSSFFCYMGNSMLTAGVDEAYALDTPVVGEVCQKFVSPLFVVYPATEMLHAVADN